MKQSLSRRILSLITALVLVGLSGLPAGAGVGVVAQAAGPFVSDGFGGGLDPSLWTFVDPLGDTSVSPEQQPNGEARLALTVPEGVSHEPWREGNFAPRLLQRVADTSLELEAKFSSELAARYQQVGLMFEEAAGDSLLFGFSTDGERVYASVVGYREGSPSQLLSADLGAVGEAPAYMRVGRRGQGWTFSYSFDGIGWSVVSLLEYPLALSAAGPFAANYGAHPPAFTALIDYVQNLATPIAADDGEGAPVARAIAPDTAPVIDIWYGPNQTFGTPGQAQTWVNILGNVSDAENNIAQLSYTVNGGTPLTATVGTGNQTRLAMPGDFNIEIPWTSLNPGANTVAITAVDTQSETTSTSVTVNFEAGNVWPLPYSIDWTEVTDLQEVAQVVDGLWQVDTTAGVLRPTVANQYSYDRMVAIGDVTWRDYEVTVPITIHRFYGQDPGVGILTRWEGHELNGIGTQPGSRYPYGGLGWYRYASYTGHPALKIEGNGIMIAEDQSGLELEIGVTYVFKMRAWSPGGGSRNWYMLKVWEQGTTEPAEWTLSGFEDAADDAFGSIALVAHRADASFGPVSITPLPADEGMVLSNIQVVDTPTVGDETVRYTTVSWRSSLPGFGRVDYGLTPGYELGSVTESFSRTDHAVDIPGLAPNTLYYYRVVVTPAGGDPENSAGRTFETGGPAAASTMRSDDFNTCIPDTSLWAWFDPLGGSTWGVTGALTDDARLVINVPGGDSHNIWTAGINAPRLMQRVNDTDFTVEVKYESPLSLRYQEQGVLVMHEDPLGDADFVHFDFYSDGTDVYAWAVVFPNGTPQTRINKVIPGAQNAPQLFMRITRTGDMWLMAYSLDGTTWTEEAPFSFTLPVTSIGITASNQRSTGQPAPAHQVVVDYFQNLARPFAQEDGARDRSITVAIEGQGAVNKTPDQADYACTQRVTLAAVPEPGWTFAGWSGDLSSTSNPLSLIMYRQLNLTATFTQGDYSLTTDVTPADSGTVVADPPGPTYTANTVVDLTAQPEPGWRFVGWSGDVTGTQNPATLTITGHHTVTAMFEQDQAVEFTLTVNRSGNGSVTYTPEQASYPAGSTVTLTATPDQGWVFAGWSGDLTGMTNPATVTIAKNTVITATFTEQQTEMTEIQLPLVTKLGTFQ